MTLNDLLKKISEKELAEKLIYSKQSDLKEIAGYPIKSIEAAALRIKLELRGVEFVDPQNFMISEIVSDEKIYGAVKKIYQLISLDNSLEGLNKLHDEAVRSTLVLSEKIKSVNSNIDSLFDKIKKERNDDFESFSKKISNIGSNYNDDDIKNIFKPAEDKIESMFNKFYKGEISLRELQEFMREVIESKEIIADITNEQYAEFLEAIDELKKIKVRKAV